MSEASPESQRFGRYRLVERLGDGGMAVVWRAVAGGPEGFERQVVIKRILPALARHAPLVRMLLDEARLCGRLHHPAIVPVTEVGEVDGEFFLAMEWVEGWDLASVLTRCHERGRAFPPGLACRSRPRGCRSIGAPTCSRSGSCCTSA